MKITTSHARIETDDKMAFLDIERIQGGFLSQIRILKNGSTVAVCRHPKEKDYLFIIQAPHDLWLGDIKDLGYEVLHIISECPKPK